MTDHTQKIICKNYPIIYKYIDAVGGKLMLEKANIQFSKATDLNDPFECYEHLYSYDKPPKGIFPVHYTQERIKSQMVRNIRRISEIIGYSSFTKRYDNLLMWSYYNFHKGICIGIDTNLCRTPLITQRQRFLMREITYPPTFIKKDYWQMEDDFAKTEYLLCTKSSQWAHEEEIRMITIFDKKELNERNKLLVTVGRSSIRQVFLGCRMDNNDRKEIVDLIKRKYPKIEVFEMEQDPNDFALQKVPVRTI